MYKSLVDMVNIELKAKNISQDSTNTGDAEGTPEKSEGSEAVTKYEIPTPSQENETPTSTNETKEL